MTDTIVLPSESHDGFAHIKAKRGPAMKFYLWLYAADENSINTCKLFWAFMPFILIPALVVRAVISVFKGVDSVLPDTKPRASRTPRPVKVKTGPSKAEGLLDSISTFMSAVYAKFAPVIKWLAIGVGALLSIAAIIWLTSLAIAYTSEFLTVLGVSVATVAAIAGCVFVLIKLEERSKRNDGLAFFKVIKRAAVGFHRHTCAKIELEPKR